MPRFVSPSTILVPMRLCTRDFLEAPPSTVAEEEEVEEELEVGRVLALEEFSSGNCEGKNWHFNLEIPKHLFMLIFGDT